MKRRSIVAPVTGLALTAILLLSGCSFGSLSPAPAGGTGGDSSSSGGDGTSGGVVVGSESGSSDGSAVDVPTEPVSGTSIPATFPTDIPLVDGAIAFGMDLGTGWSVIITAADPTAGYDDAKGRLLGAGFTSQLDSTTSDGSFGVFQSEKYLINLTATDDGQYGPVVSYVVVVQG